MLYSRVYPKGPLIIKICTKPLVIFVAHNTCLLLYRGSIIIFYPSVQQVQAL